MAQKKKIIGTCCICGRTAELTYEHIPPKSAFNHFSLRLYNFNSYILRNESKHIQYTQHQQGAGEYTLCESCNNLTGTWYGSAYAEFARQGLRYYHGNAQGALCVPYRIYPLRVLKQIVSCFASVNGPFWCQQDPSIREFILNPEERRFPKEIDIRMYMQTRPRIKQNGIYGVMSISGERFVGSEWAYPPFAFVNVCDTTTTKSRVLNELYSVRFFLNYRYDDYDTLYLRLPRKPCNPIMLDFRENVPDLETLIRTERHQKSSNG